MELLRLEDVCFSYDKKQVLYNINYTFEPGKIYAVTGKSGAGKTTLLSILSGLTDPVSGNVYCNGENLRNIDKYNYRSHDVGVIFQSFNLLTKLTSLENVMLSMDIAGCEGSEEEKKEKAYSLLEKVGLDRDEADRRILKLSGGQQQRVAIARAISYDSKIIMADEPTGNLDSETQKDIMDIFEELANEGRCIIIVTHSAYVANRSDERVSLTKLNAKGKAEMEAAAALAEEEATRAAAAAAEAAENETEGEEAAAIAGEKVEDAYIGFGEAAKENSGDIQATGIEAADKSVKLDVSLEEDPDFEYEVEDDEEI